jgi:hypothetical protein
MALVVLQLALRLQHDYRVEDASASWIGANVSVFNA